MSFASLRRHASVPLMAAVVMIAPVSVAANAATAPSATAATTTQPAIKKVAAKKAVVKKAKKKKKPHVSAKKAARSPRAYAHKRVEGKHKWSHRQWNCLNNLWGRESGWQVRAGNKSSGAYGIPQALPGHKMGRGWRTNGHAQVRWGLKYINDRYDTPCKADRHQRNKNWY